MPANVETAVYSNTPAWHREGIVLDSDGEKGLTIEKALPASGLDWEVEKVPIFAYSGYDEDGNPQGEPMRISDRWGVQRVTDKKVFGTVGRTWQPVQNTEGFQLINDVIAQAGGQVWIEAAGALDGGKKVWVLAHVDDDMQIAGEMYNRYIGFTNGHDGRTSVTAFMCDERIVCANTLDIGLREATAAERIIRVRHTKNAGERVQEAAHILGMRNKRSEELAQMGEWFVEQEMSDGDFMKFMESLMPIETPDTPAATMIGDRRAEVASVYFDADNLDPIRGTRWGALQAVVEYSDHRRSFKDSSTQLKAQFGLTAAPLKQRAVDILTDKKLRPVEA